MSFPRFKNRSRSAKGGFTLVELLVVIGIIAILAGVALGPITSGIRTAQHNTGMQSSRSIALLCFQYSVDYNGVYPCAGPSINGQPGANTATGIAQTLLSGKYVTDPGVFFLSSAPGKVKYTGNGNGGTFADFTATNVCWDFMAIQSSPITGLTSNASDLLPVVWCSGNPVVNPTAGTATNLTLNGAENAFGKDGIAVTYHSNSAQFIRADGTGTVQNFIQPSFADTTTYQDLQP